MQTLRPFSESENDLSMQQMRKSAVFNDGENAFAQPRGKGQERGVTFKGTPGVASTRKALGNITNHKGAGLGRSRLDGIKTGGKTPGGGLTVRRALGDITNATPARELASSFQAAAPVPDCGFQNIGLPHPTVTESQIAAWAEEGVEQRAGKSWVQLDAERMLRSEAEMNASLCAVLSFPPPRILCPKDSMAARAVAAWAPWDDEATGTSCPASPAERPSPTSAEDGGSTWEDDTSMVVAALPDLDSHSPFKSWNASDLLEDDGV